MYGLPRNHLFVLPRFALTFFTRPPAWLPVLLKNFYVLHKSILCFVQLTSLTFDQILHMSHNENYWLCVYPNGVLIVIIIIIIIIVIIIFMHSYSAF